MTCIARAILLLFEIRTNTVQAAGPDPILYHLPKMISTETKTLELSKPYYPTTTDYTNHPPHSTHLFPETTIAKVLKVERLRAPVAVCRVCTDFLRPLKLAVGQLHSILQSCITSSSADQVNLVQNHSACVRKTFAQYEGLVVCTV